MRNLTDDSVMSNCISADTEFHINHRQVELWAPFLLLCATDGCFAYVRSPMHFEHLLLSTLGGARDTGAWGRALEEAVTAVSGDDAALTLLGLGADLDGFKGLLKGPDGPRSPAATSSRWTNSDGQVRRAEQELATLQDPPGRGRQPSCGAPRKGGTSAT